MLPARHRLTERADFTAVLRGRGTARAGSRLVVVFHARTDPRTGCPPRVGFVVSKAVGNAVVRNRTKRRLRAVLAAEIGRIAPGSDLVIRALPDSATAEFARLQADVRALLQRSGAYA